MSKGRRLLYILAAFLIVLVVGYFIYTDTQMDIEGAAERVGALGD